MLMSFHKIEGQFMIYLNIEPELTLMAIQKYLHDDFCPKTMTNQLIKVEGN